MNAFFSAQRSDFLNGNKGEEPVLEAMFDYLDNFTSLEAATPIWLRSEAALG